MFSWRGRHPKAHCKLFPLSFVSDYDPTEISNQRRARDRDKQTPKSIPIRVATSSVLTASSHDQVNDGSYAKKPIHVDFGQLRQRYWQILTFRDDDYSHPKNPEYAVERQKVMYNFAPDLLAAAKGWAKGKDPFCNMVQTWWEVAIVADYSMGVTPEGDSASAQLKAEMLKYYGPSAMKKWQRHLEDVRAQTHSGFRAKDTANTANTANTGVEGVPDVSKS